MVTVPQILFRRFHNASLQRLPCLYPGCGAPPVLCHLVPENVLRSRFGGHCLECRWQDKSTHGVLVRMGVGQAGVLPVFCGQHDHQLFKDIDESHDCLALPQHRFLLSLKAIAFALRKIQGLLGFDFQVELFKPFFVQDNLGDSGPNQIVLNCSFLHGQYAQFASAERLFAESMNAFKASKWDYFSYYERELDYPDPLFFAGPVTPSHDLNRQRIDANNAQGPIICNFFTVDRTLHLLFACPDDATRHSYTQLLEQLRHADEVTFVAVANNFLTISGDKPLLSDKRIITAEDLHRIVDQREEARRCHDPAGKEVFDLRDATKAVPFIAIQRSA